VSLLDVDPDLGALLEEQRRTAARTELLVRVLRLARGQWAGGELGPANPGHVGLLVLDARSLAKSCSRTQSAPSCSVLGT
jgi:hypothetical protein